MSSTWKKIVSLLFVFVFLSSSAPVAPKAVGTGVSDIEAIISDTAVFLQSYVPNPGIGQTGGDWVILALMRSGAPISDSYVRSYYNKAIGQIGDAGGVLSSIRYSEFSRVAIAMTAIGADPRDVGGYDLLAPLWDYEATCFQGINGPIFALIALSASGFQDDPIADMYLEYILSRQFDDGGFAISGAASDTDMTAMALTALASYTVRDGENRVDISDAITRGVERLSRLQRDTGGYSSFFSTNSESVSQVIIALSCLGISVDDERFIKSGNSLLDNLLTYYIPGSGFEHESNDGASLMATEQALSALGALWRLMTGRNSFYDMSDAPSMPGETVVPGLPGKHPDINVPDINGAGDIFESIREQNNGSGIDSDSEPVTRAEFIAALTRVLGLRASDVKLSFTDVIETDRYYSDIQAAYHYGIVEGRSAEVFDPEGFMTRQEAGVAIYRAAVLCGLGSGIVFDEATVRNILSQFVDYRSIAPWSGAALAFCYYFNILDDLDIEIRPLERVDRENAAEIIFRMLKSSLLVNAEMQNAEM